MDTGSELPYVEDLVGRLRNPDGSLPRGRGRPLAQPLRLESPAQLRYLPDLSPCPKRLRNTKTGKPYTLGDIDITNARHNSSS